MRATVIICIFRIAVEYEINRTSVPCFFSHLLFFSTSLLPVLFIFSSPDASIEILLVCSFEWFEVLKRRSITRHLRDSEEEDAIAEEDGRRRRWWRRQWRKRRENFSCRGNGRSNSSTRIVRRVLIDYLSRRKPVDQQEFIVIRDTAFAIDIYSYLDERLVDVDVTLGCLTYTSSLELFPFLYILYVLDFNSYNYALQYKAKISNLSLLSILCISVQISLYNI